MQLYVQVHKAKDFLRSEGIWIFIAQEDWLIRYTQLSILFRVGVVISIYFQI